MINAELLQHQNNGQCKLCGWHGAIRMAQVLVDIGVIVPFISANSEDDDLEKNTLGFELL